MAANSLSGFDVLLVDIGEKDKMPAPCLVCSAYEEIGIRLHAKLSENDDVR